MSGQRKQSFGDIISMTLVSVVMIEGFILVLAFAFGVLFVPGYGTSQALFSTWEILVGIHKVGFVLAGLLVAFCVLALVLSLLGLLLRGVHYSVRLVTGQVRRDREVAAAVAAEAAARGALQECDLAWLDAQLQLARQ